jgi:hypothetical protein
VITCPVCHKPHNGPRDLSLIHHEVLRFIAHAAEMPVVLAAGFMRVHLLSLGLELSALCANCNLNLQASVTGSVTSCSIDAARAADLTPPETDEQTDTPSVCKVIPLFPRRPLLDLGAKYDSEPK